ncbi:deoxynucleoside monophosphate kinase [Streptomyces phage Nesbitt]|uniref:Deoxynucleoside monophosphate kinase n=2 Tax=Abbeymikolonvirus abbeymikolon TaxID=2734213 RepID=A0A2P1JT23_9CAUD|nr:deoxynucleoside monophosphate kinase [Streptomyces phage AbbeyMikolon]AUG87096.1 deoxynucleoside monophosphate kinase [Streptomyces phage AbbeyMikolon]AVO22281.1 deoxynucleoside monophosphate kinase [Streptomyces phage Nesbitt]
METPETTEVLMAPKAPHIGLIGKARSGKDTAAARMVQTSAYTRLAFADPLREALLKLDPQIVYGVGLEWGPQFAGLQTLVGHVGWERAKAEYPEVRRLLQNYGQTIREMDPEFWVRELSKKVAAAHGWNMPVVVTDVRYRNEAEALKRAGFYLVRVERPGAGLAGEAAQHASETELDDWPADLLLHNNGTKETFLRNVDITLQCAQTWHNAAQR